MISIENELFTLLAGELRDKHKGISVYGEYIANIAKFPCVIIEEKDNSVNDHTITSGETENYANVMYEINVYSNKDVGKKSECKAIFQTIDNKMKGLGFVRKMLQPISNLEKPSIYRMVGRYESTVSKENVIYRR